MWRRCGGRDPPTRSLRKWRHELSLAKLVTTSHEGEGVSRAWRRSDRFVFLPMLYELATGSVACWEVAPPFEEVLAGSGVEFVQGDVRELDTGARMVGVAEAGAGGLRHLPYDQCVLALGAEPVVGGVPGAGTPTGARLVTDAGTPEDDTHWHGAKDWETKRNTLSDPDRGQALGNAQYSADLQQTLGFWHGGDGELPSAARAGRSSSWKRAAAGPMHASIVALHAATRAAKRTRVKQEMSRGPLGGRRAAHARAHVLLSRQHQLLLRALNASDMPPNVLNEVVSAQARALKQSEFRLHVAYQLFDEALRGFERRLPRESIERRSAVVPPGGLAAMAGAIPGFDVDEKNVEAKETTCPICADVIAPGQTLCALDCEHLFHPACIQDWVHSNPSCPMCRETVLERARGDPEDEPEPESDAEGEGEREADESEESGAGAGARFPGAPPGFVPAAVFESMMRAMAGRGGAGRFPGADASSPDESFESGDEDDLGGEESEDSDDLVLGMTNAEVRRMLRRPARSARSQPVHHELQAQRPCRPSHRRCSPSSGRCR